MRRYRSGDNESYLTPRSRCSAGCRLGVCIILTVQTRLSIIVSHTYLHHNCFLTSRKHEFLNGEAESIDADTLEVSPWWPCLLVSKCVHLMSHLHHRSGCPIGFLFSVTLRRIDQVAPRPQYFAGCIILHMDTIFNTSLILVFLLAYFSLCIIHLL